MKRSLQTIGKLFLALTFAVAISAAPLGCNEPTNGDNQDAVKACPAGCTKACCKTAKACPSDCAKACCKKA